MKKIYCLKVGKDRYHFKEFILPFKKEILENHEQKDRFLFKKSFHGYKWYIK